MFRRGGGCTLLGICAAALGAEVPPDAPSAGIALFRPGPMGLTPEQMEMVDPEYEFWRDLRRPKGEGGESRG